MGYFKNLLIEAQEGNTEAIKKVEEIKLSSKIRDMKKALVENKGFSQEEVQDMNFDQLYNALKG